MSETQTPSLPKTRFDVSPELSEVRHYLRYLNSRDCSASGEDIVVLQKVGMRTNIGRSSSSSLPKLKLNSFDGNPLEWPEWSSMFFATIDKRTFLDSDKKSHLKTLLRGKGKSAISGMGNSGQFYSAAWRIQERNFGRPHVIIDAQLESLRKANQVRLMTQQAWLGFLLLSLTL